MAITVTGKLGPAIDTADATSKVTASWTPASNTPYVLVVFNRIASGTANEPTVTGNGMTWVSFETVLNSGNRRITLFRTLHASPSAEEITIDFAGQTQTQNAHMLVEFAGADTSGTNGSGAIVQSGEHGSGSGTSYSITLSAFGSVNNVGFGASYHFANEVTTPGTDWTELYDIATAENTTGLQSQWKLNDNVVTASWASSVDRLGVGCEIKAAVASFNVKPTMFLVF